MSQKIMFISLVLVLLIRPAQAAEFGYPAAGEAWYYIKASFSNNPPVGQGAWSVTRITVNGTRARDFLVFQNGRETAGPEINGHQPFAVKIRWIWQGRTGYEVKVDLENAKTKKALTLTDMGTAPAKRGYWNAGWKKEPVMPGVPGVLITHCLRPVPAG